MPSCLPAVDQATQIPCIHPSRAAFSRNGTSEPAPPVSACLHLGRALTQPRPRPSPPHTPERNWGSLRLLISIRLKAGVPAKIPAATGHHNLALPEERGTGVPLGVEEMHCEEGSSQIEFGL